MSQVKESVERRRSIISSVSVDESKEISKLLFAICATFIFCNLPHVVTRISIIYCGQSTTMLLFESILRPVRDLSLSIYSCSNVIYLYIYSGKFRDEFRKLLHMTTASNEIELV